MRRRIRQIKDEVVARAGDTFADTVRLAMNQAAADAQHVREQYPGLPYDALADILVKRAARKTKWEGAANGFAVTGCEALVAAPAPEPGHKLAAGAGVVALLLSDIAYTTRVQIQLLVAIGELYGCPFDGEDEEDAYTVFKAALGLKGTERLGSCGLFVFAETARKQFRKLLRTGIRRAVQDRIIKIAGPKVGRYLAEKQILRLVPIANAGIGYAFNNRVTKSVGRWAKVKAKVRSSVFAQVAQVAEGHRDAALWILPLVFYVGTADDTMTDNLLTLYSQTSKRLALSDEQAREVDRLINLNDLAPVFAAELPQIPSKRSRLALYDIAVTTAAINLTATSKQEKCCADMANWLEVEHNPSAVRDRVSYLMR